MSSIIWIKNRFVIKFLNVKLRKFRPKFVLITKEFTTVGEIFQQRKKQRTKIT